jgi:hypothetical protein
MAVAAGNGAHSIMQRIFCLAVAASDA